MFKLINHLFSSKYLLVTNTCCGIGFMTIADTTQQIVNHYKKNFGSNYVHDYRRTCKLINR